MDQNPKIARYAVNRYITPKEFVNSDLYGDCDKSFCFSLVELQGPRSGEYRLSLGVPHWAVMWVVRDSREIHIEITYLDQNAVEDIMQTLSTFFNVEFELLDNANHMFMEKEFKPREV